MCPFHFNKLKSSLPMDAFCYIWLKLAQWFYRRRYLNFVNVFSLFGNHLPVKKGRALHLNNQIYLYPRMIEIGPLVLEKKIFFKIVSVFSLFPHYLPLEKGGVFHFKNLNSLHSRMICAKFG